MEDMDDDATREAIYKMWFGGGSRDTGGINALLELARDEGYVVAIVRSCLKVVQQTASKRFTMPGWHKVVRGYRPAAFTAEEAMAVTWIVNQAAKFSGRDSRFYVLKAYCIWASMKLGAMGGWDKDQASKPVYVVGIEGFGTLRFHVGDKAVMNAVLGEFSERQAAVYPLPDHAPDLKVFRELAEAARGA